MLDAIESVLFDLTIWVGFAILAMLYFLPSIVVLTRRAHGMVGVVIVLNVFLGWTFLGWVISLALSMAGSSAPQPAPHVAYPQVTRREVRPFHSTSSNGAADADFTGVAGDRAGDS